MWLAAGLLFAVLSQAAVAQIQPRDVVVPPDRVLESRSVAARQPIVPGRYDWPQFDFDQRHSGNDTAEIIISPANVSRLAPLFSVALPEVADGAPVILIDVTTSQGMKDLLFLTTKAGRIVALDVRTGALLWMSQSATGPNFTTSSPAIDPNRRFVYSYGLEGAVHKYSVVDGTEVLGGGWPETVTLKPDVEKGSSALSIAKVADGRTFLYAVHGGYPGDAGDYQGHVTTIDLASGSQNVFHAACSDFTGHFVENGTSPNDCSRRRSAVWGRPGAVYDEVTNRVYFATGNGVYDGFTGGPDWGDSLLAIAVDGTGLAGGPLDSYTPNDFAALANNDEDLGSVSPALMPALPTNRFGPLCVQGGKDSVLRLLAMNDLSQQGGARHVAGELQALPVPQGGRVLAQPAVWTNPVDGKVWIFVATDSGISGLQVVVDATGMPSLLPSWGSSTRGTSPIIAGGVLFYVTSNQILALDPVSGAVLWSDAGIGEIHWESPVLASGILYITDERGMLNAYSLDGQLPVGSADRNSRKR